MNKLLLLAGTLLAQSANANSSELEVAKSFVDIFMNMLTGSVGNFFIVLIIIMSGVMAWRNGNLTPLFWGLTAGVVIGAAPKIADALQSSGTNF